MILAELSHNHRGSIDAAKILASECKDAGAWGVKTQFFFSEDLSPAWSENKAFLDSCTLSRDKHAEFVKHCIELGIQPVTTVAVKERVLQARECGYRYIKIASPQCMDLALIHEACGSGAKTIVSTGGTPLESLVCPSSVWAWLHCVSLYPTPPNRMNLSRMIVMKQLIGGIVGFSSHLAGDGANVLRLLSEAIHLGSELTEVHYTNIDRKLTKDGPVSLDYEQLKQVCEFDKLPHADRELFMNYLGRYRCEQSQEELDLVKYYRGRWKAREE